MPNNRPVQKVCQAVNTEKGVIYYMALNRKNSEFFQGVRGLRNEGVEIELTLEQVSEIAKCSVDSNYFINNYCHIVTLDEGKQLFRTRPYQDIMLDIMDENTRAIFKLPRQSGKSAIVAAFLVWEIVFKDYHSCSILANKEKSAKNILKKVKLLYKTLPMWMQQGVIGWSKLSIELENASYIEASATSASGTRSDSINTLVIDECAWIPKNIWDEFYSSIYPTVSSSKKSKIIMVSTPRGMNHFYKFWHDAEIGKNTFAHFEIGPDQVPAYAAEGFKEQTIAELGMQKWMQEYECQFLGSSGTLISSYHLQNTLCMDDPMEVRFDDHFRIFEMPIRDEKEPKNNGQYILMCDFGEGVGLDYNTIQVMDITKGVPWREVAVYEDNTVAPSEMPYIIERIGKFYNEALVIGETNTIGIGILDDLNYDLEYENIFYGDNDHFGIKMTKSSKKTGCMRLKQNVEDGNLEVQDQGTITQFSTFVKVRDSYAAEEESDHDDLITPLVLFSYFMANRNWTENWLDQTRLMDKGKISKIEEDLLPAGFVDNGIDVTSFEGNADFLDEDSVYGYME